MPIIGRKETVSELSHAFFEALLDPLQVDSSRWQPPSPPSRKILVVDIGTNFDTRGCRSETEKIINPLQSGIRTRYEVLIVDDSQAPQVLGIAPELLMAVDPMVDQAMDRHESPLLRCVGNCNWVAKNHEKGAIRKQRLQKTCPDQIGRRLLDQYRFPGVPMGPPLQK